MRDNVLSGKAKELQVAALLTELGFYVFLPLVDKGFDLVITGTSGKRFIPIQVKYRAKSSGFTLKKKHIGIFNNKNVLLAFIIGDGKNKGTWFIPFEEWHSKSEDHDRLDEIVFVSIDRNDEWLTKYKYPECNSLISKLVED
jgi:hypothetical protein